LANTVTGKGAVVVPAEWMASADAKAAFYMPVALIGTSAEKPSWIASAPEANPLLIYSLRPPTPTSFTRLSTDNQYMDMAFKKPDLGSPDVSPVDCVGSYRIFIKGADGQPQMIDTRLPVTNSPNDHVPVLASLIPSGTVAVGLASEDKVMLDPSSGRPLLSAIAWLAPPITITASTVHLLPGQTATLVAKSSDIVVDVTWTVDQNGTITTGGGFTASAIGKTKIVATSKADPSITANQTLTIYQPITQAEAQKAVQEDAKSSCEYDGSDRYTDATITGVTLSLVPQQLTVGSCGMIVNHKGQAVVSGTRKRSGSSEILPFEKVFDFAVGRPTGDPTGGVLAFTSVPNVPSSCRCMEECF
jgi:hypothetical protein